MKEYQKKKEKKKKKKKKRKEKKRKRKQTKKIKNQEKNIIQVPDTGTHVFDNTGSTLRMIQACSRPYKYSRIGQYWYAKMLPYW